MKIMSRADAGLPPRTATAALRSSTGITVHWNGGPMGLLTAAMEVVLRRALGIWRFHVEGRGWADIAYNWLVAPDGTIIEGRGWGIRSAAQGTIGNRTKHAVMLMIGVGEKPTDEQLLAVLWLSDEHRRRYGKTKLVPHHRWSATSCPGPDVTRWLRDGAPEPEPTPEPAPPPLPKPEPEPAPKRAPRTARTWTEILVENLPVRRRRTNLSLANQWDRRIQGLLAASGRLNLQRNVDRNGRLDGKFGPSTESAVRSFQRASGIGVDGIVGRQTWTKLLGR